MVATYSDWDSQHNRSFPIGRYLAREGPGIPHLKRQGQYHRLSAILLLNPRHTITIVDCDGARQLRAAAISTRIQRSSSKNLARFKKLLDPSVLLAILKERTFTDCPFNPGRKNSVGFDKNLLKNALNRIDSISNRVRHVRVGGVHNTFNCLQRIADSVVHPLDSLEPAQILDLLFPLSELPLIDEPESQSGRQSASDQAEWTVLVQPVVIHEPLEGDGNQEYGKP